MKKKKNSPSLFAMFRYALYITGISLAVIKKHLPDNLQQEFDQIQQGISNTEPAQELEEAFDGTEVEELAEYFIKSNSETESIIDKIVDAKVAELGIDNEQATTVPEATGQNATNNTQNSTSVTTNSQSVNNQYFKTYNFSEDTLYMMVKLAAAEQGSQNLDGMAVEMSLMLNVFEIDYKGEWKGETGEKGFRMFISADPEDGGWFANAPEIAASEAGLKYNLVPRGESNTENAMQRAEEITKEGKRTIPPYINQHVSAKSVEYIETDGVKYYDIEDIKNINNYKPDETIVMTKKYGAYRYAGHFAGTTDPFGYREESREGKLDVYYERSTGNFVINGEVIAQIQNNEVDNNITKTTVSLTDDLKYAEFSRIHSDSAILYTNNNPNKKDITICVNAGHGTSGGENVRTQCHPDGTPKVTGGSTDAGSTSATAVASGMTFLDGTEESEATLRLAVILRDKLLDNGYNVLMIREGDDIQLDNIARTVLANNYADYHIALHWDSTDYDKGAYYMKVPDVASYKSMEPVASTWEKSNAFGEALIKGLSSQGCRIFEYGSMEMDLTQTSYSTIPSIDIELGDRASDRSDETLANIADGLLTGIDIFYNQNKNLSNAGYER